MLNVLIVVVEENGKRAMYVSMHFVIISTYTIDIKSKSILTPIYQSVVEETSSRGNGFTALWIQQKNYPLIPIIRYYRSCDMIRAEISKQSCVIFQIVLPNRNRSKQFLHIFLSLINLYHTNSHTMTHNGHKTMELIYNICYI